MMMMMMIFCRLHDNIEMRSRY